MANNNNNNNNTPKNSPAPQNVPINKAGITPLPVEFYPPITTGDIIKYLQNQLTIKLAGWDFGRWESLDKNGYIWMKAAFFHEDIVASKTNKDYVDRVLEANANSTQFKDTVYNELKKYMYGDSLRNVYNDPERLQKLADIGIIGQNLDFIVSNMKLAYCAKTGLWEVHLRVDKIIEDMFADPATNSVNGEVTVVKVHGNTVDTIRWDVIVNRSRTKLGQPSNLLMDAIYPKQ